MKSALRSGRSGLIYKAARFEATGLVAQRAFVLAQAVNR